MKQSLKDRDCAIRNAEEGAADLKRRAEELSHSLNEYETQYQVNSVSMCWSIPCIIKVTCYALHGVQVTFGITVISDSSMFPGCNRWQE